MGTRMTLAPAFLDAGFAIRFDNAGNGIVTRLALSEGRDEAERPVHEFDE